MHSGVLSLIKNNYFRQGIIWLLISGCLLTANASYAQDSTSAIYINTIVERIESRLSMDILEVKDSLVYDSGDSLRRGEPIRVQTRYYTNSMGQVEKIIERSHYKTCSTELVVYYLSGQPVRFTSTQKEGSQLKLDFDIYYHNNDSVYFVKRMENPGRPDPTVFLSWCYDLLRGYTARR